MNNVAISVLILALITTIINYEFVSPSENSARLYDFEFNDFFLQNISSSGVTLHLKSKNTTIKKNEITFKQINLIKNNTSINNKNTEYINANNMSYRQKNILFKGDITYKTEDVSIYSQNINYNLEKNILQIGKSKIKIGKNAIKSDQLYFDIKNKNLNAKNIEANFILDSKISL